MRNHQPRKRGYILVEAMISSAVLGVVLMVTLQDMGNAQLRIRSNALRATSLRLAAAHMEKLRNYSAVSIVNATPATGVPGIKMQVLTSSFTDNLPPVALPYNLKTITVKAFYGSGGNAGTVTLSMTRAVQ